MFAPIQLFESLDKTRSEITKLRKAQYQILEHFQKACFDKRRIGIKLPTGAGKSLIALLILEAWRREGNSVAILCANKGLCEDMKKRCEEISIPSATIYGASDTTYSPQERFKSLLDYQRKRIIGIFNYNSFLYGLESISNKISTPDILVIDDASDFEITRNEYYSINILKYNPFHKNTYNSILMKLLEYKEIYHNLLGFMTDSSSDGIELVLYIHDDDVISIIRSHLSELNNDDEFRFSYQRNQKNIDKSLIFISSEEIQIRPLIYPEDLSQFSAIKQIIYMSATLPDEELLHKIYGVKNIKIDILDESILDADAYSEIETMGKRLIFPISQSGVYQSVDVKSLDIILNLLMIHKKALILVNSNIHGKQIQKYLEEQQINTILYRTAEDSRQFAYDTDNGALICVNRYIGLDFPRNTCQIEIIVKLPKIWDCLDAFQTNILKNRSYSEQRIGNRLTQALGRCNRLIGDEALYYIIDSSTVARLSGDLQYLRYLPRNLFAEMMTGYNLSMGDYNNAIEYGKEKFFGKSDPQREEFIEEEKQYWTPRGNDIFISNYDIEIEGWYKFLNSSYSDAGNIFESVGRFIEENIISFTKEQLNLLSAWNYYLASWSFYKSFLNHKNKKDKENSINLLMKSISIGERSSWFNNLRGIYNELVDEKEKKLEFNIAQIENRRIKEQIALYYDEFIDRNTSQKKDWKKIFNEYRTNMDVGTHGQCLVSLEQFLKLMGYGVRRGNNQKGEPDLIVLSPQTTTKYQLGIEVKTKDDGDEEKVESVRQILGDAGNIGKERPDYLTIPLLVTQKNKFSEQSIITAKSAVKLINTNTLQTLIEKLYEKMNKWSTLDASQKWHFTEQLISPHEIYSIFMITLDPVSKPVDFQGL